MTPQGTILLAEDDDSDIRLVKFAFEEAQVRNPLRVVRNGQEAIDYLSGEGIYAGRDAYPLPALMLLDLKLPLRDGFEVLAWCQEHKGLHGLRVIVMSSSHDQSDIKMAMALGAVAYRVKPADFGYLVGVARELRDHWLKP